MATTKTMKPDTFKADAIAMLIEDDHVTAAQQRVEGLRRALDDVTGRAPAWGQVESRRQREDREKHEDLREALAGAERDLAVAVDAQRTRYREGRRAHRADLLRTMIRLAEPLLAGARSLERHDQETARALGHAEPTLRLRAELERELARLTAELNGPPPDVPVPAAEGKVRVRLLGRFHDKAAMGQLRLAGDFVDLDTLDAEEAVQRGFAEAVEA